MKKTSALTSVVFGALVVSLSLAYADHHEGAAPEGMPPMGPPDEMKQMAYKVGTWDVDMKLRMDAHSEFMNSTGEAHYQYILGGAVVEFKYTSDVEGMPFEGRGYTAFNRSNGKWQEVWMDVMGAYISLYEGAMEGDQLVLHGVDYMDGEEWLTRTTQSAMKDGKFNWMMEHSTDGGKSWAVYLKSEYTKRM
jgi:hypothetical protein